VPLLDRLSSWSYTTCIFINPSPLSKLTLSYVTWKSALAVFFLIFAGMSAAFAHRAEQNALRQMMSEPAPQLVAVEAIATPEPIVDMPTPEPVVAPKAVTKKAVVPAKPKVDTRDCLTNKKLKPNQRCVPKIQKYWPNSYDKRGGKLVCWKKNDKPHKSNKNPYGDVDMQCCLDPDEIPNPWCTY
jgi:hypothetical protein